MKATVVTYGKRSVHVHHKVPIPRGWRIVGVDPYDSKPIKRGDKWLSSTVSELKKGIFKWTLVPKQWIGVKAVITRLVIRKRKEK